MDAANGRPARRALARDPRDSAPDLTNVPAKRGRLVCGCIVNKEQPKQNRLCDDAATMLHAMVVGGRSDDYCRKALAAHGHLPDVDPRTIYLFRSAPEALEDRRRALVVARQVGYCDLARRTEVLSSCAAEVVRRMTGAMLRDDEEERIDAEAFSYPVSWDDFDKMTERLQKLFTHIGSLVDTSTSVSLTTQEHGTEGADEPAPEAYRSVILHAVRELTQRIETSRSATVTHTETT